MVSRQRLWQIKMNKNGQCRICGQKSVKYGLCQSHLDSARIRSREDSRKRTGAVKIYENCKSRKAERGETKSATNKGSK